MASQNSVSGSQIQDAINYLKQFYSESTELMNVMLKSGPFFGLVTKEMISGGAGNSGGTNSYPNTGQGGYPVPILGSGGASPSQNITSAISNTAAARTYQMQVPIVTTYNTLNIGRQLVMATRNDQGAFQDAVKVESDAALISTANQMAQNMYRNTSGVVGTINSLGVTAAGAIQLSQVTDAVNFQPDMALNAFTVSGGVYTPVQNNPPGSPQAYVISVDRGLGVIYVSTSQGGSGGVPGSWTAGCVLIGDGNSTAQYSDSATNGYGMAEGFLTWIPDLPGLRPAPNLPSTINFLNNQDRSKDVVALAGVVLPQPSETIEDTLIDLCSEVYRVGGGTVDHIFMNPVNHRALEKELTSRRIYMQPSMATNDQGIGFPAIEISTASGPVKIVQDRWAPVNRAFAVELDTWKIIAYDELGFLSYLDGLDFLRTGADSAQARVGIDWNMICKAPGHNGVAVLNS